jgi:ureidoglycolate hydrolase
MAATWAGEGLRAAFTAREGWMVGFKNYKPACDLELMSVIERHLETEEVFVLLSGECSLVLGGQTAEPQRPLQFVRLEPRHAYCIERGTWHNTLLSRDAALCVIENADTSGDNSECAELTPEDRAFIARHR